MPASHVFSRRDILGMAGAVGGLAVTAGIREAWAQAARKIESMAPELDRIISKIGRAHV